MIIEDNELKFASIDTSSVADLYTFLFDEKGLMIHPKTSYKQCLKEKKENTGEYTKNIGYFVKRVIKPEILFLRLTKET